MTEEATPGYLYKLYDYPRWPLPRHRSRSPINKKSLVACFDELTGGELEIATIPYSFVTDTGQSYTRHMSGRTSYSPVTLLRAVDVESQQLYRWFREASLGRRKGLPHHLSITMMDLRGNDLVYWDMINAIPTKLGGFSFNQHVEKYYVSVELTIQAEEIIIHFEGSPEEVEIATTEE
jgi:phage tail-like protein